MSDRYMCDVRLRIRKSANAPGPTEPALRATSRRSTTSVPRVQNSGHGRRSQVTANAANIAKPPQPGGHHLDDRARLLTCAMSWPTSGKAESAAATFDLDAAA
jgi:hypothetical protein